jgi:hypothetical protein
MIRAIDRESLVAKLASQSPPRLVEALPEKYYRRHLQVRCTYHSMRSSCVRPTYSRTRGVR